MSYSDKKLGTVFPTRTGTPAGGAMERKMLDTTGGSSGYRKQFKLNSDGSTTMLATKNGMPQFITSAANSMSSLPAGALWLGMDSGALKSPWTGSPTFIRTGKVSGHSPGYYRYTHWIDATKTGIQSADNSPSDALGSRPDFIGTCPASMFTGRMRLYVQALYGRLAQAVYPPTGKMVTNAPPSLEQVPSTVMGSPGLIIAGVAVDTSTGIFFDPINVEHYLICVTSGTAFKMKPTVDVTQLIAVIKDSLEDSDNKHKAEAYILAHSIPDVSTRHMTGLTTIPTSSFGYGWHFNYSGTTCDMVGVDSDSNRNISTSYTINTYLTGGKISAAMSNGGSITWYNKLHYQIITYPIWDYSGFAKIGQKFVNSDTSGIDAPFYVYYQHDLSGFPGSSTKQLCTFQAIFQSVPAHVVERTPDYLNPGTMLTLGDDVPNYVTTSTVTEQQMSLTVTGNRLSFRSYSRTEDVARASKPVSDTHDKDAVPYFSADMWAPTITVITGRPIDCPRPAEMFVVGSPYGSMSVYGGNGSLEPSSSYAQITYTMDSSINQVIRYPMQAFPASWTYEYSTDGVIKDGRCIAVIPYNDAEAAVLFTWERDTRSRAGTRTIATGNPGFEYPLVFGTLEGPSTTGIASIYQGWTYLFGAYYTTSSPFTDNSVQPAVTMQKAVGSFGARVLPGMPFVNQFFNTMNDIVPVYIDMRSSTGKSAFSETLELDVNNNPAYFGGNIFTYIGWA